MNRGERIERGLNQGKEASTSDYGYTNRSVARALRAWVVWSAHHLRCKGPASKWPKRWLRSRSH